MLIPYICENILFGKPCKFSSERMLFLLLWGNCISFFFLRSIIVHVKIYRALVWETCNSV